MRIDEVNLEGLKGIVGTTTLAPLMLITGPNGSGKSARLDALRFAIQGDCRFGAQPRAIAKLGTHRGLAVTVRLHNGYSWRRAIERDAKSHACKETLVLSDEASAMSLREADARLEQRVGRFAPTFDLGAFLSLSGDLRRDYVLELCGDAGDQADADDLVVRANLAYLQAVLGPGTVALRLDQADQDSPSSDQQVEAVGDLNQKLAEDEYEALRYLLDEIKEHMIGTLPAAIGAGLRAAKGLANESRRERDQAQQAVKRFAMRKAELQIPAETVEALKRRRTDLQEQAAQIREQIAHQAGRASALASHEQTIRQHRAAIAEEHSALDRLTARPPGPTEADADAILARAARLEAEHPQPDSDFEVVHVRAREAGAAARAAREKLSAKESARRGCARELEAINRAIAQARALVEADPWREAKMLYQAVRAWAAMHMPPPAELEQLGRLIREQVGTDPTAEYEQKAAELQSRAVRFEQEQAAAAEALELALKAEAQAATAIDRCQAADRARTEAWKSATREAESLRKQAEAIRRRLAEHESSRRTHMEALQQRKADLLQSERALQELQSAGGLIPIEQLQQQRESLEAQLAGVEDLISAKQRHQTLESELTRAIAVAEQQSVRHEVAKRLATAIRTLRETLMADLVRPLTERINQFLAAADAPGRAYCDLTDAKGKPILELGWIPEGADHKVPLPGLSGGETALYGAGLAYALIALAAPPLKLLLIEAAELDDETLAALLRGIAALSDRIDNAIVCSCHDPYDPAVAKDWEVVELRNRIPVVA